VSILLPKMHRRASQCSQLKRRIEVAFEFRVFPLHACASQRKAE
jgi:hypothetical protein